MVTHPRLPRENSPRRRERVLAAVPHLPALTHLHIKRVGLSAADVHLLLEQCSKLQRGYPTDVRLVWGRVGDVFEEFWDDWMAGCEGREDLWERAETVIAKRRATTLPKEVRWVWPPHIWQDPDQDDLDVEERFHSDWIEGTEDEGETEEDDTDNDLQ